MTTSARLRITLDEPVAAGTGARSDFRRLTHNHIPGSVLRGALAAEWIARNPDRATTEQDFLDIFESTGVFGPLHNTASLPVPLSVRVHKYEPTARCTQLWWDEALGETAQHCDRCDSPLVPSKGQPTGQVAITGRTSVALDTDGVAIDEKLFHDTTLARQTRLTGWVHGTAVAALHLDHSPVTSLLFGSRRGVRGKATVEIDLDTPVPTVETARGHVVLRLASPGVFVDAYGLPTHLPDTDELAELLDVDTVRTTESWPRWTEVGGWHAASGLPKPTDRAVAAGSVYLLRCTPRLPTENALQMLAARGIGLRRREGYGALYRLPPRPLGFHTYRTAITVLHSNATLWRTLRDRPAQLGLGDPDDTILTALMPRMPAHLADALRTVLPLRDAAMLTALIDHAETR